MRSAARVALTVVHTVACGALHATFGTVDSLTLSRRLLPDASKGSFDYEQLRTSTAAQFALSQDNSFSIVSYDAHMSMFFCAEISARVHSIEGWIVRNESDIFELRRWHRRTFPHVTLVTKNLTPEQRRIWYDP